MSGTIKRGMAGAWVFALAFFCAILSLQASPAQAGYAHFIMDANTGKVLAAQNADVLNHPASLTKMMTLYMTFEALHMRPDSLGPEDKDVQERRSRHPLEALCA